jgi:hypothetical protein
VPLAEAIRDNWENVREQLAARLAMLAELEEEEEQLVRAATQRPPHPFPGRSVSRRRPSL